MSAAALVLITLQAYVFGWTVAAHGKPRTGTVNANRALIALAIWDALLAWGGFFSRVAA